MTGSGGSWSAEVPKRNLRRISPKRPGLREVKKRGESRRGWRTDKAYSISELRLTVLFTGPAVAYLGSGLGGRTLGLQIQRAKYQKKKKTHTGLTFHIIPPEGRIVHLMNDLQSSDGAEICLVSASRVILPQQPLVDTNTQFSSHTSTPCPALTRFPH